MKISIRQLRSLINEAVQDSLIEASSKSSGIPSELEKIVKLLPPNFKLSQYTHPVSWRGEIRISEKRSAEQKKMNRIWTRIEKILNSSPWFPTNSKRNGWNSQTDTGGNYNNQKNSFSHTSTGLEISLNSTISFQTGTKIWGLTATYPHTNEEKQKRTSAFIKHRDKVSEVRGHQYSNPRDHIKDSNADISDLIDIMNDMEEEAGSVEDARNQELTDEAQILIKRVLRSGYGQEALILRDSRFAELLFTLGL